MSNDEFATSRIRRRSRPCAFILAEDPVMGSVIQRILEASGLSTLGASGGFKGMASAAAGAKEIDVAVVDVDQWTDETFSALMELGASVPGIPVLLMAGSARTEDLASARRSGVRGFIQKPVSRAELLAALDEVLALTGEGADGQGASCRTSDMASRERLQRDREHTRRRREDEA